MDTAYIDSQLSRLEALQGTDPAIFSLAVHAFIEGTLRQRYDLTTMEIGFNDLVFRFLLECKDKNSGYIPEYPILKELKHTHMETNEVRHKFAPAGVSCAEVATLELECFCKLAGLGGEERLSHIRTYLASWDQRICLGSLAVEYERMKNLYSYEREHNVKLAQQVTALTLEKQKIWELQTNVKNKDIELTKLEQSNASHTKRIDQLRNERFATQEKIKEMQRKIESLKKAQEYMDAMRRMTVFTRTRGSYEKLMLRLSSEQSSLLDLIHLDRDFLIRGSAGTGKSLVLIKAMEKAIHRESNPTSSPKVALLTFTNTLVKFNKYMVSMLSSQGESTLVSTVDAFLLEQLQVFYPLVMPSTDILVQLCASHAYEQMGSEDLAKEIDCFLLKQDISYTEYVTDLIPRKGMKKPLKQVQRQKVWEVRDAVVQEMEQQQRVCFSFIPVLLLKVLKEHTTEPRVLYDQLFIDEAQDLGTATLRALKLLCKGSVVLCGDDKQSIYQVGSFFTRSGLDVVGRSKLLRTNFRNSVQIHSLAQAFKEKQSEEHSKTQELAFRDGPMPELFQFINRKEHMKLLADRVSFFCSLLEYEPENICILTPSKHDFPLIRSTLEQKGFAVSEVLDKEFSFEDSGAIRMSTLHSAKGLDFPVVLLCLGSEPKQQSQYDDTANEQILRNLIYVSITRALDHLNLFIPTGTTNEAYLDLIDCFTVIQGELA
ncbi:MAG: UvrD-helicase domain-containing protein [Sphaerochaeta sp.]|nr:UvrD-helicase domain-containing protein [Sphaerochaeta sp.]